MLFHEMYFEESQYRQVPGAAPICTEMEMIIKLKSFIEQHYRNHHNQEFYLDKLNATYYYLNSRCQHYLKKSVNQLIQDRLFKESCLLLIQTLMSVKTITYELGFSDPSNFNRFFKRHAGMTAIAFRTVAANGPTP